MLIALAETLLARYNPTPTALLVWLKPQISDDLLRDIAAADYGCELEANFRGLLEVRDDGVIISHKCLPNLGEVLALTQYSEAGEGGASQRGHLKRAFSAATLIRAGVDPANGRNINSNFSLRDPSIVQLIRSVRVLGSDAIAAAARLLAWAVLQDQAEDNESAFLALGIVLLEATRPHVDADEHWLCELTEWAIAMEAVARSNDRRWVDEWDTRWFVGLNYYNRTSSQFFAEQWQSVSLEILAESRDPQPRRVSDAFFALAEHLSEPRP
jgi:hypothetical protein